MSLYCVAWNIMCASSWHASCQIINCELDEATQPIQYSWCIIVKHCTACIFCASACMALKYHNTFINIPPPQCIYTFFRPLLQRQHKSNTSNGCWSNARQKSSRSSDHRYSTAWSSPVRSGNQSSVLGNSQPMTLSYLSQTGSKTSASPQQEPQYLCSQKCTRCGKAHALWRKLPATSL